MFKQLVWSFPKLSSPALQNRSKRTISSQPGKARKARHLTFRHPGGASRCNASKARSPRSKAAACLGEWCQANSRCKTWDLFWSRKRSVNFMDRKLRFRVSPSCNYVAIASWCTETASPWKYLVSLLSVTWSYCTASRGSSRKTRFAAVDESSQQVAIQQVHNNCQETEHKNSQKKTTIGYLQSQGAASNTARTFMYII